MRRRVRSLALSAMGAVLGMGLLCGCASPGPARAPSLKLPEIATGLVARRVGDEVRLQWTTPSRTTDKLLITEPIEAEICRVAPSSATSEGMNYGAGAASDSALIVRKDTASRPCAPVVLRELVTPGVSEAVDRLPPELTTGSARLLAYRVQLCNAAGRTAGATDVVYASAGAAPHAVQELRGRAAKAGVVLEWRVEPGDSIELNRMAGEVVAGAGKKPAETHLRVDGEKDTGGTVDRTARIGQTYRYLAQRVRTVDLDGQRLELRSGPSAEVVVERKDLFPPEAPVGLVAVPGFGDAVAGQGTGQGSTLPVIDLAIDLSWEPDMEPRIMGYRVYRRALDGDVAGAWQRLNAEVVPVAVYRDRTVVAGHRYGYRVTAVDAAGNESERSREVVETAPTQ